MRILLVDLDPQWRGGQNQGYLLLCGLRSRGHQAELLAPAGAPLTARAKAAGVIVHEVPRRLTRLSAARRLRSLLHQEQYLAVHVNEPHALTAAWLAGAHRKTVTVISRRVAYRVAGHPLALARYRATSCVFAISRFVFQSLLDSGLEPDRLRLLHEGVELSPLPTAERRCESRARWGVAPDENLLGCVGYLLPEKGQETLLRALPEIRTRFPGTRLLLAGDGPSRSRLENLARELNLGSALILPGVVEEISQVYRALDVFLFPSLAEPLGTSLLVAMAYALPVVSSDGGAGPEVVDDGVTGLLRPPGEPEAWAEAVCRLLTDRSAAERLGTQARETIAARFSADRMVDQTLQAYLELAARRGNR